MKRHLVLLYVSPAVLALAMLPASPALAGSASSHGPADRLIRIARDRIASGGADSQNYNALAVSLTRKARETGDPSYYDQALEALGRSERSDPGNLEALRISAWVRMGRHEFEGAYRITRRYAARRRADPWNLGVMGDALMELGRYRGAAKAYQEMVDLRPGPASYSRAAYAREIAGDAAGAVELMRMALEATDAREVEDRAWLIVQIGQLQEALGDPGAAEASYRSAIAVFPAYHYGLAALARVVLAAGRAEKGEALARDAVAAAPHAECYLILADSLRAQGREEEALAAEGRFETLALGNTAAPDNENHDLVLFYLERRVDPLRALEIARREAKIRRDIHTLDRLAWALHWNGRSREAARLMRRILATGTCDPLLRRHGQAIERDIRTGIRYALPARSNDSAARKGGSPYENPRRRIERSRRKGRGSSSHLRRPRGRPPGPRGANLRRIGDPLGPGCGEAGRREPGGGGWRRSSWR